MNYCITYFNKPIEKNFQEINIELAYTKNIQRDLEDFCNLYKDKRINLCISNYDLAIDKEWLPFVFDFQQEHQEFNIYIRLPYIDTEFYPNIKEKYTNAKIFFNIYAKDWDTINGLIKENVTDIYITEELGFSLKEIAAIVHKNNIQIRVFPNVAQSSWKTTLPIKKLYS